MPRSARKYELFLPLTDNAGHPIPLVKFDAVERQLLARFGGLTTQQHQFPLKGVWQGEARIYLDQVILMTVLDFHPRGSSRFITELKRALLQDFDQLEILITESSLRVY